jgi:hypothetical protein
MTREQWKDLLEGIGILAIIASLLFVGIETRQSALQTALNTQALEIAAYQELMDNIAELNLQVVGNPEVAAFMHKAYRTDEPFDELEQFRFSRASFARFRHGDMAYFQYQRGVIDESRLRSVLRVLNLGNRRVQQAWAESRENFVGPYRAYVDSLIAESGTGAAAVAVD